jgi:methylglutaconyl-CoA hydratase
MAVPFPMVDPDDPKFKWKTWATIEGHLKVQEAQQSGIMGLDLEEPEEDGPTLDYPCRPLMDKFPWEEKVENFAKPASCTFDNWRHDACLKATIGKGCVTLVLCKASNNGLDPEMLDALQDAIMDLQKRKEVRAVILKAEGKLFSTGFDPKYILSESTKTEAEIKAVQMQFAKILHFLSRLPQVVIALAQGSAIGAGIGLFGACDVRYAVKNAFFAVNEGKLGVVPSVSLPYILRHVALGHCRPLVLSGSNMSATQAKGLKLVNEVFEDEAAMQAECNLTLERLTTCAPSAVAATKEIILNTVSQMPSIQMINYVAAVSNGLRKTPEASIGLESVAAKKQPAWSQVPIAA